MVADKSWNQRFNLLRFFDSELFPSVQGCRVQEQMECLENKLLYFIFGQPAGYCFKPVLVELEGDKCWPWWFHRSSRGHLWAISMWRYRFLHLDWPSRAPFHFSMASIKNIDPSSSIRASFAVLPHLTNHSFLIFLSRICTKILDYILNPRVQRGKKNPQILVSLKVNLSSGQKVMIRTLSCCPAPNIQLSNLYNFILRKWYMVTVIFTVWSGARTCHKVLNWILSCKEVTDQEDLSWISYISIFYWGVVDLLYCSSFRYIAGLYTYTCIYS